MVKAGTYFLEPGNDFTRRHVNRILNEVLKETPAWEDFTDIYLQVKAHVVKCGQGLMDKLANELRKRFRLKFKIWSLVGEKLKIFLTSSEFRARIETKRVEGKHDRIVRHHPAVIAKRSFFCRR